MGFREQDAGFRKQSCEGRDEGTLGCWAGQLSPPSAWGLLMEATLQTERSWASGNKDICEVVQRKSFTFKKEENPSSS